MKLMHKKSKSEDIAIIGLACRFPGSNDVGTFWENLVNGKETISRFSDNTLKGLNIRNHFLNHPNYVNSCGYIENIDKFDNDFFKISPNEAAAIDPQHRLFLEEAYHALEDAGYSPEQYKGKIGVYAGSGSPDYYHELLRTGFFNGFSPSKQLLYHLGNEKDFLALRTAYLLNLTGASVNVNLGCATGLVAVIKACQALTQYESDIILAGAVSLVLPNHFGYIYQPDNIFSLDGYCKPFDKLSTGTVLSGGVGIVVLKRLSDAINDKDTIHAVIAGYALNNDGSRKLGFTAPSIQAQSTCIEKAIKMAKIKPFTLKYIEAHGTGTKLGDPIEVAALGKAYGKQTTQKQFCAIGSVKSNIGHTQSAAGIAGLIKLILSIKNKTIPPTLHFKDSNPEINFSETPFFVNSHSLEWTDEIRTAGINCLAMGGVNSHLILKNFTNSSTHKPNRIIKNVILLSAKDKFTLNILKINMLSYLKKIPKNIRTNNLFSNIAYTLQVGRNIYPFKSAWLCNNIDEAIFKLEKDIPDDAINLSEPPLKKHIINWFSDKHSDWKKLYLEEVGRISLPNYPFKKNSHWLLSKKKKAVPIKKEVIPNKLINDIINIWEEVLGIQKVDIHDQFENLGGDSLLAVDLVSKIEKRYGAKLSIETLLIHNTPAELATCITKIKNENANRAPSIKILSDKKNARHCLFIIHPGNGELYSYRLLAQKLDPDFLMLGIQNNIFNDSVKAGSISICALAKLYINLIKKYQSTGPYVLCGWSFGGSLAYEIANQMLEAGDSIAHVILIDSWAKYSKKFSDKNFFFNNYLKKNDSSNIILKNTGLWGKLLWGRMKALIEYLPPPLNIDVTLLKAKEINKEYADLNAFDNHWLNYCKKSFSTILVSGNHESLIEEPNITNLMETLNKVLNSIKPALTEMCNV